jgi:hypothetical protein
MKSAEIYSEPASSSHGYVWRWRTEGGPASACFNFFYECLEDARHKGYDVRLDRAHGDTAPNRDTGSSMK